MTAKALYPGSQMFFVLRICESREESIARVSKLSGALRCGRRGLPLLMAPNRMARRELTLWEVSSSEEMSSVKSLSQVPLLADVSMMEFGEVMQWPNVGISLNVLVVHAFMAMKRRML